LEARANKSYGKRKWYELRF